MSVSIKVAIRCRPFTVDDKLGVKMRQMGEEEGEVELINCDYTTKRFPFTFSWWSAYGYKRHLIGDNMPDGDDMQLVDQVSAYNQCGLKIKSDLLGGNAVVLFAYGLSGSGKTYTVFGPDAVDAPEAWFKHPTPQPLWKYNDPKNVLLQYLGIFPRLAYELFEEKQDGWKISMKYFQNVVDTVRDLMSPSAEEQHYKSGMRKDPDGFMDIEWCGSTIINSWDDLRQVFQKANARKAIAPTQFNPMSTRGHCIMMLEVEMPSETEGVKQRGRVYVCDLAGTEPAGDIVYALYNKVNFDDGTFEYHFQGAHADMKKTKELQEQGKKINLSLSEMSQFFMKMAEAVIKKKLTPGMSIPGCNSFFLCKYLKDTMLQARTYLFCAIRPEVQFLKYTFATLGFAKNASVVKLAPKKATMAASPGERKLMAELEAMKALVEQLKSQNKGDRGPTEGLGASGDSDAARMIADLQQKLADKQGDLQKEMTDGGLGGADNDRVEQQRAEYKKRGIYMVAYEAETNENPYFTNLDEDAFRSNRFMYILQKQKTIFGSKGDIQLHSLAVVRDHCHVRFNGDVHLIGGKGDTWRNGKPLKEGEEIKLEVYDRVGMGDQLMLFRWPGNEDGLPEPMTGDDAVAEFQEGLINFRNSGGSSGGNGNNQEMEEERKRILEEREKWENEKKVMTVQRNEVEYQRAMASVDNQILDLLPKLKEAKHTVDLFNRLTMTFDVVLEKGAEQIPRVKISVVNSNPKLSILIEPQEFLPKLSLMKDEMMRVRSAIDGNRTYEIPERHDPLYLMFDNDFHLGTSTHWPEYLCYNLETDEEEKMQDIKNSAVPYNTVGLLELRWFPLFGPDEGDELKTPLEIDSEEDFLGKPWTYRLEIKRAADLPVFCEMAYVEYEFFGETFTTEVVQQTTYSPSFEYSKVHHISHVTPEFLKYLKGGLEMHIHVTQHVDAPPDKISTSNTIVVQSIQTGEAKGYEQEGTVKPKSDAEIRNEQLILQLNEKTEENNRLKNKITELELTVAQFEKVGVRKNLNDAIMTDSIVNGAE